MTNYSDLIAGWNLMGPREKFNSLARLRKRELAWIKIIKDTKFEKEIINFIPPEGFYQKEEK